MRSAWTCQKGYQCDESCHNGGKIWKRYVSINLLTSVCKYRMTSRWRQWRPAGRWLGIQEYVFIWYLA